MTNHSYDEPANLEPDYGRRMSHAEAVMLCRYAKAACPQQAFDQFTPDAWSDLLGDLRFEDCQVALRAIVQRQPFVSPAEIRGQVQRVRNKRIGDFGVLPSPPPELDPAQTSAWTRDLIRRIGDGEVTEVPDPPGLEERDMRALMPKRTNEIPAEQIASHAERVRAEARAGRKEWTAAQKPEPEPLPELTDDDRLRAQLGGKPDLPPEDRAAGDETSDEEVAV